MSVPAVVRRGRTLAGPFFAEHGPLVALVVAAALLAVLQLRDGHDFGDDFSLYIDQARALLEGDVGAVSARTTYTVQNSSWSTFSPYNYPWAFPLLLVPFYAVFGLSYTALKMVGLLTFLGLVVVYHGLLRTRLDRLSALLLAALVALNESYMGWVNFVLSDIPFAFTFIAGLWIIEHLFRAGRWVGTAAGPVTRRTWLGLAGAGAAFGFVANMRREGALLVGLLAIRQALTLWQARRAGRWRPLLVPFLVPYAGAAVVYLGMRALLPSEPGPFVELAGGIGPENWRANVAFYRPFLGDVLGLDEILSDAWISAVLVGLIVLAVGGALLRLREDLPLVVAFVTLSGLYLMMPVREGRYLYVVILLGLYFVVQGLRGLDVRRFSLQPRHVALVVLVALCTRPVFSATDYWNAFPDVVRGPHSPDSTEMWDAVERITEEDDVVAFFRARTMNLYTGRQSVQLTTLPHILERADWYVMDRGSTYSQCLIDDDIAAATHRLTKVWENGTPVRGWTIWKVDRTRPLSAMELTSLPGCLPA